MAEGARRVMLIAPKPLLGQWREELFQLFDIDAREGDARPGGFDGEGVILIGREAAGSEKGRDALLAAAPFDLCIIDEAHEVFAGIYKRFDKFGEYDADSQEAQTAGRVREVLLAGRVPVLLLTATPIQNRLSELWGLVQFVDPLGTLLGDLHTFREVFCGTDDRTLAPGQEDELRARLRVVLQRTLRRQAQDFLEKPFVNRQARLFDYTMSPAEKALYVDVTKYLLEPGIVAFRGGQRQLLLLGFHRRMASSTRALAASLDRVAERLRRKLTGSESDSADDADARSVSEDLEDEAPDAREKSSALGPGAVSDDNGTAPADAGAIRTELLRVESFIQRAGALGAEDSKFRSLLKALNFVTERALRGQGAGRLVIFTESLVTQEYLRDRLVESRFITEEDITLFRGMNDSKRAREALDRWRHETPQGEGRKPSTDTATRLALVHEFKTRSKVFISTEAGAKGLNLQFADTVVNYDLPWNPQRIEQRIGRCHRYGQRHDVTVINFLAKDNEAQNLTFEILSQKLELFGTVLDASDHVLHRSDGTGGELLVTALGAEFEAELRRVYERARTIEEVTAELRALRDKVAEERRRFEETHARVASLIEKQLDDSVQSVFRRHKEALPRALAQFDHDLLAVVLAYLDARGAPYERVMTPDAELLRVAPSSVLRGELREGIAAAIGSSKTHVSLHLGHPLVVAAVADAREGGTSLSAGVKLPDDAPPKLRALSGQRARLRLVKLAFDGFELVDLLVPVAVLETGEILEPALGDVLLRATFREAAGPTARVVTDEVLEDATEEMLFSIQSTVDAAEHVCFELARQQAECFIEDRLLVLKRRRRVATERVEQAILKRDGATGSESRSDAERVLLAVQTALEEIEGAMTRLEQRDDPTFRKYQEHIERRRYTPPRVERVFDMDLTIE